MNKTRARRGSLVAALVACFCAGVVADWWLRVKVAPDSPALAASHPAAEAGDRAVPTTGEPIMTSPRPLVKPPDPEGAVETLHDRDLRMPIDGIAVETFKGSFDERRGGRPHEAADILAPRHTPVHAVEDGTIAKLFYSKAGGNTIYQFDPSGRFTYYYAHLERYADGLRDGLRVKRGDVIGYVGTSGNAPPGTPHLHFAIFELAADRHWWRGEAIDPYRVFRRSSN